MKYFSMFSGIGGFELGIQRAFDVSTERGRQTTETDSQEDIRQGLHTVSEQRTSVTRNSDDEHTDRSINQRQPDCVGYSEIDKYAIKVYERQFNGHTNYGDATAINPTDLPDFDLLVGGFPCQAFSVAGKRAGFNDTRGTLFFDIARILAEKRPRHLVLENVKGLLSHDSGKTFQTILGVLSDLGYRVEWQVLNSKDFGVPQNRERIIIVGHLGDGCGRQVFPIYGSNELHLEEITSNVSDAQRIYTTQLAKSQKALGGGLGAKTGLYAVNFSRKHGVGNELQEAHTLSSSDWRGLNRNQNQTAIAIPVLTPDRPEKRQNGRRFKEDGEPAFTVTAQDRHGLFDGVRIRRLTPRECERLQGFPDNWTALDESGGAISDTQRYKMCGNAVTVNVVEAVMAQLFNACG